MPTKSFSLTVERTSTADPATLFALVSDGARWPEWAKPMVPTGSMVAEGQGGRTGVGAVRKLGVGPIGVREKTTASEQDRLHAYTLLTPGPVKNYQAEVHFEPRTDGGTDLRWKLSFDEVVPGSGKVAERVFGAVIGSLATKLARAAEKG